MFGQNYILSLPERAIRSAAALVGGTTLLLTETLLPDLLRESTTYRVTIGDLQRFLINRLAEMDTEGQALREPMSDAYLRKKMVGGVFETIGLLTVRFSPVWVFAIASDAAGGGKVFMTRLADHLRANDLITQDAAPENLVDLLEAIQFASQTSARAIDTPPLSREELTAVAGELSQSYSQMFTRGQPLLSRFDAIWGRMERVAQRDDISLEELSGLMAANAAGLGKTGLAITMTGAELVGEKILDSYIRTLDEIGRQGAGNYISHSLRPYLEAAVAHLDPNKITWTEEKMLKSVKDRQ